MSKVKDGKQSTVASPIEPVVIFRWWHKLKNLIKAQGMPKYQNLYLGNEVGKLQVKNGGGVGIVKSCYYDPSLASYIYWLDANGVMVTVPEKNLKEI